MEKINIDKQKPSIKDVNKIAEYLSAGKIVVLPTETVYTLAVDATNEKSLRKVYEIKGRNFNKPLHVVVASMSMATKYVYTNQSATLLAKKFLPGPLTLVLKKRQKVLPEILTSGLPTLGVRIPDLPISLLISEVFGKPYTTTSANTSGGQNPYSIKEVLTDLENTKHLIDLIVDVGKLPQLKPSTLIDLTKDHPVILRQGPVSKEQLENVLRDSIL